MTIAAKKQPKKERRLASTSPPAVGRATSSAPWKLGHAQSCKILEAPALARLAWLIHGFSTRAGRAGQRSTSALEGESSGRKPGAEKFARGVRNFAVSNEGSPATVRADREKFFRALGAEEMEIVTLRQIHSDIAHCVDSRSALRKLPAQGDALMTRQPGILLAVQTADCIPILLVDTKTRAVAAVHSGWRGTLARIAAKTLGRMQMEFGTEPRDVVAALGPGIGRCCYEVGPEVAAGFQTKFPNASEWFDGPFDALAAGENDPNWLPWLTMKPPGHQPPPLRARLDLIAANRAILAGAGMLPTRIFSSGLCTACRSDLFFSYRREPTTGRMIAAIGIR
jgi:polyphenol oxidase